MAVNIPVKAKPPINIEKLVMWKMVDEINETYGAAMDFDRRVMSFRDTLSFNSTPLYGTGVLVDKATVVNEGAISYNAHALTAAERVAIYGETQNAGNAVITTGNEIIPYVASAHATRKRDGKWNLYKYFKVQFQPHEETTEQITQGSMTYSTITLNGTYMTSEVHEMMRAILIDVDPSTETGAAIIANWFADPLYVGSNGFVNTSTIKVGDNVIANGGTIASGSTVTFVGSSTGGTPTVTYSYAYRAVGSDSWTTPSGTTCTVTVATDAAYEFLITATDGNGVTLTKTYTATVEAGE